MGVEIEIQLHSHFLKLLLIFHLHTGKTYKQTLAENKLESKQFFAKLEELRKIKVDSSRKCRMVVTTVSYMNQEV